MVTLNSFATGGLPSQAKLSGNSLSKIVECLLSVTEKLIRAGDPSILFHNYINLLGTICNLSKKFDQIFCQHKSFFLNFKFFRDFYMAVPL